MADPRTDDGREPAEPELQQVDARSRRRATLAAAFAVLVVLAAVVVAVVAPPPVPGEAPSSRPTAAPSGSTTRASEAPGVAGGSPPAPTRGAATPAAPPTPMATLAAGRIAYLDASGGLAVVGGRGDAVSLAVPGLTFGPPAWSPDGSRVAAIGAAPDATGIYIFDVASAGAAASVQPELVYSSADHPPFYLYWSPDGARVGFLATEGSEISLRVAMSDGSRPKDGPGHDGILRVGAPLYFTWEDAGRMVLHVGSGPDAFAGEIDMTGETPDPGVPGTGDFRAVGVSHDGGRLAYVTGDPATAELVVGPRDGTGGDRLPVFGPAALAFDPVGETLAWIAADRAGGPSVGIPFGPLRVRDAGTGAVRTLVDDSAVGFFWSPDGQTIAVLRVGLAGGRSARSDAAVTAASVGRPAAATPAPAEEVHLTFVDVATGAVRSDRTVRPADDFTRTILPYFDQYALSHRVWASDSSSIALPLFDEDGRTRVMVLDAGGADVGPVVDGVEAFWAP